MSHHFHQTVTGHCPFLNEERSLEVVYSEIPILNEEKSTYKISGYDCDDYEECPERYCPIAQEHATL